MKAAAVTTVAFALLSVMVRVEVPPRPMAAGPNAFASVGCESTVSVADAPVANTTVMEGEWRKTRAIDLTLKLAFQGRKHWRGVLAKSAAGWQLALDGEKAGNELNFVLDEVREARLVPVVDFKGRARSARS